MRTPLQALIAAGNKLAMDPETFDVNIGNMKGRAITIESREVVESPMKKVVGINGTVTQVPGKTTYRSEIVVVWDVESAVNATKSLKDNLDEFKNRILTRMEHGDLSDLDFEYGSRD
jgi:hypothetical protein